MIGFLYIQPQINMTPKDQYKAIRENYLKVFEDSFKLYDDDLNLNDEEKELRKRAHVREQKIAARGIVDIIVNGIFFENRKIYDGYASINNAIKNKKLDRKKTYSFGFKGKLDFLCDYNHINETLKSEYNFVYTEGSMHSSAHPSFKEGEKRLIHIIKVFLNEILDSFLTKSEADKSFLIPMHVIAQDDPKFHKRIIERVDSFWNIKRNTSWFVKYKTVLSYAFTVLLTILIPQLAIIFIVFGILKTQRFTFKKKVKKQRYLFYILTIIMTISNFIIGNYMLYKFEEQKTIFDSYIFGRKNGFLMISKHQDFSVKEATKTIVTPNLNKGDTLNIYVVHGFRNMGIMPLESGIASLDITEERDKIIFTGHLSKTGINSISDTVIIKNIKAPYHIDFIEGQINNEQGKDYIEKCEKYLYKMPLSRIYCEKTILKDGGEFKGIYLNQLGTYNKGWCDAGYILSHFRITKL